MADVGDMWAVRTSGFFGWAIRLLTRSPVNHAGVWAPNGMVGEARPSGFIVDRPPWPTLITIRVPLTPGQRAQIPAVLTMITGTRYNFLDIAALAVALISRCKTPRWVARRLARPDRLMCSQAVDLVLAAVGFHLYDDGRLAGEVTPGDILTWQPGMGRNDRADAP